MIKVRSGLLEDHAFIMSSWLQSHRASSDFAKDIPEHVYFKWHHALLEALLARETTRVLIATPQNDTEVVLGYIVYEKATRGDFIHYVYVKRPFGHMGICKELLSSVPFDLTESVVATHQTYKGARLIRKLGITYCPYAI